METEYIPKNKCKEGHLYEVTARNGPYGIFINSIFRICGYTCGAHFIEKEKHWDDHPKYGTVKPLKDLGIAPDFKDNIAMIKYLKEKNLKYWERREVEIRQHIRMKGKRDGKLTQNACR